MFIPDSDANVLKLALPKGRMEESVIRLLDEAGISVNRGSRGYRPGISLPGVEVKILKPQNIIEMLDMGSRDLGFSGLDWAVELNASLVELLDTELDPVEIVVAAPEGLIECEDLPARSLVVASEYSHITKDWIKRRGQGDRFVKSFGATEVFPPEDADCIVDNTSTGSTLRANGLRITETILRSSTRLFANPHALENPIKKEKIDNFSLLVRSVLDARKRVMLELNAPVDKVEQIVSILPSMREATLAPLHDNRGFSIRAAVPKHLVPSLIIEIKARGGSDIVVTKVGQIVP